MPTTLSDRAARTGALSGVLSGLLVALPALVEIFIGETVATSFFLALSPAFALPLLTALHRRQSALTGHFGETAYVVNLIGLGLFGGAAFTSNLVLFSFDDTAAEKALTGSTVAALIGSAAVFAAGSALFGAALLRARVFPRLSSWAYATVLPPFAFLTALPDSALTSTLHFVVGATLACLAAALWRSTWTVVPRTGKLAGHGGSPN
ncbi:hypothetical protein [Streptomyces rimosus]|uniref:hypothetical protein n=1 Tax=Streptomyces rimosus TaxID=1927 RepID=UPI0007C4B221|nr:hypothetical protein [Streptomyces rimosus]